MIVSGQGVATAFLALAVVRPHHTRVSCPLLDLRLANTMSVSEDICRRLVQRHLAQGHSEADFTAAENRVVAGTRRGLLANRDRRFNRRRQRFPLRQGAPGIARAHLAPNWERFTAP
jgi:hypothetical protein